MKKVKKGFLLIAFITPQIDYIKMAYCCALSIKSHLENNHVSLITDKSSYNWLKKSLPNYKIFDNIIIEPTPPQDNIRTFYDSPWSKFQSQFQNQNRSTAYELSPYEETILLDVDYLIMSNQLDLVWENKEDLLINKSAVNLRNEKFHKKNIRLSDDGIPMYWATLIYFKKCEMVKIFFDLTIFIRDNYSFYKYLYNFPGNLYRNDYIFSMAMHIMNGFNETDINSFPIKSITTMDQVDDIVEVNKDSILFLSNDTKQNWINTLVNLKNTDVHILNKRAFIRHSDKLIELFSER